MKPKEARPRGPGRTNDIVEELLDPASLLVSVFDEQGNICRLNAAMSRALSRKGMTPDVLLSSDLVGGLECLADRAQRDSVDVESSDFEASFLVTVEHLQTSVEGFYVQAALDVTAMQNTTRMLAHAQKMNALGESAGKLAHDFSNILSGILGYATLLLEDTRISAGQQKALDVIRESAERGEALIEHLHSLSPSGSATTESVDLNHVVLDVITVFAETVPKSIRLITELSSDLPRIHGDRLALFQLVLNLTTNAKDAIRENGTIIVRTSAQEGPSGCSVLLQIEDDGMGMSPEVCEHLDDPFYSTKAEKKRRGLGLTVVYGIVKSHGGTISCASEPALGTTFTLTFPLDKTKDQQDDGSPAPFHRLDGEGRCGF